MGIATPARSSWRWPGDLIVAAESAKFADTHARWALTPIWGMSQRLPRRVGPAKAREMMLTCRTYSGAEAAAMGLANVCIPDDLFDKELRALADSILANSWFSHRANKRLLIETDGLPLGAGLAHEVYRNPGVGPGHARADRGVQQQAGAPCLKSTRRPRRSRRARPAPTAERRAGRATRRVSRAAASQLSPVFLRPTGLARRHLDAERRAGVAGAEADELGDDARRRLVRAVHADPAGRFVRGRSG